MASTLTYRSGNVNPIPVQTAPLVNGVQLLPIQDGDLVGYVTIVYNSVSYLCVVPANAQFVAGFTSITAPSGVISNGAIFTSAANFFKAFAGVALHKTGLQPNETTARLTQNIDPGFTLVGTAGRYEYALSGAATVKPGDLLAINFPSDTTNSQTVATGGVASTTAIGVAVPGVNQLGQSVTSTVMEIKTTLMHGDIVSGQ